MTTQMSGMSAFASPRTYGVSGLKVEGFSVDKVISAGSNPECLSEIFAAQVAKNGQSRTMAILKYNLRHRILALILKIISFYKMIPVFVKQCFAMRVGAIGYIEFETATANAWYNPSPETKSFSGIGNKPHHILFVLDHHQRVAEPLVEDQIDPQDGQKLQLLEWNAHQEAQHCEQETSRLITEITNLIEWVAVAGIPVLTIYEKSGFVSSFNIERLTSCARDKLALALGNEALGIEIRFHVLSTGAVHSIQAPNPNRLDIVIVQESDAKKALINTTLRATTEDMANDRIHEVLIQSVSGTGGPPDMLVLLGSKASVDGYPSYALKDALI